MSVRMVTVTFIGTAGSTPTKSRALPAMAIELEGTCILFDCGEGTQRQMQTIKNSISPSKVDAIFLSHIHADHTLGVAGLVRSLNLNKREAPLDIYIPREGVKAINALIKFDGVRLGYDVNVHPIAKGGTIYKQEGLFRVDAFKLNHGSSNEKVTTYGFVFKENSTLHFIEDRAKRAGLKNEMHTKLLREGTLNVNGKTVRREDVTVLQQGVKIVYATDTRPSANTTRAAEDADLLVHEATYANDEYHLARKWGHSTAEESARLARNAKDVKRLVLIHISARYNTADDLDKLLRQATQVFPDTEIAEDGMRIELEGMYETREKH